MRTVFYVSLKYILRTLSQQNQPSLKLNSNLIGDNFFKWQNLRMQPLNSSLIDICLPFQYFMSPMIIRLLQKDGIIWKA